jgi:hypothetical protein
VIDFLFDTTSGNASPTCFCHVDFDEEFGAAAVSLAQSSDPMLRWELGLAIDAHSRDVGD